MDKELEAYRKELEAHEALRRKANAALLKKRVALYNKIKGPRVGDWIVLANGNLTRFTYKWNDGLQIGDREHAGDHGSFYLGDEYCSYSGSLDPAILSKNIRATKRTKAGRVWFFDKDIHMAHNGVDFMIKFRVFEER